MECREIQDWLLEYGPTPPEGVPAEVAEHMRTCGQCAALAGRIAHVERAVRDLPVPAQAQEAKQRFLQKIQTGRAHLAPRGAGRLVARIVRWQYAAAAMVLLAAGAGLWMLVGTEGPDAQAATVVERLVDWNLDLASRGTIEERKDLYAAQAGQLQELVNRTPLTTEDGETAKTLLASGAGFCGSIDPLADAEIFCSVADVLTPRLEPAAKPNTKIIKRRAKLSARVEQKGVVQRLEKVVSSGKVEGDRAKRVEKVVHHNDKYQAHLTSLLVRVPESDRRVIRQSLAASKYLPKAKKAHTPPNSVPGSELR